MNIFKHDPIEGRPFFTDQAVKPNKTDKSILKDNPLLGRLKPSKNPSKVAIFFRRFWAQISQYFGVKHPDAVKEEMKNMVRPIESDATNLTVGNIWHHYEHFLTEDKKCPPALKKCFDKMEQDEKEILKLNNPLQLKTSDELKKANDKYIAKTVKRVQKMKVGQSRLFLLNKQLSTDQSLNGDLFCTISRTKDGYVISFTGSGSNMDALHKGFPLAGKDKSIHTLSFETIDADTFKQDPFLTELVTQWVAPQGVKPSDILAITKNFTAKAASSLEDYNTKSSRPDKLFWNIVLSIPQENSKTTLEATTPASIRSIRLRAELLTLYEAYDDARIDLDPKSRQFKDLSKLLENVSGKVLLQYKKGYLSDKDFEAISKRLKIMDDTLRKAKQAPNKTISSSISVDKPAFPNVSLKKAGIEPPQATSPQPAAANTSAQTVVTEELNLPANNPISLNTYADIKTKDAFIDNLTRIYSMCDSVRNGTNEEQTFALNEAFRFLFELPFNDLLKNGYIQQTGDVALDRLNKRNPDSLWWKLTPDEAESTLQALVDLSDIISKMKQSSTITQYEYESILKLRNISVFINAVRTGFFFESLVIGSSDSEQRLYNRVTNEWSKFSFDPIDFFDHTPLAPSFIRSILSLNDFLAEKFRYKDEDYKLIRQQEKGILKLLDIPFSTIFDFVYSAKNKVKNDGTFKHWIRPINNAFLSGLYKSAVPDLHIYGKPDTSEPPEAFFDNPEGTYRNLIDEESESPSKVQLPGIPKELKALSRLLRRKQPHTEFLAFMTENSHLLYNHDIRNFFDALFFNIEVNTNPDFKLESSLYPQVIESEIAKIQNGIDKQLQGDKVEDPALLQERFELLLYFHEILIRIKGQINNDEFPDLETRLEELCTQCKTIKELNPCLGYASRLLLRLQLENNQVEAGQLGNVLNTYADIHTSSISANNVEPQFEHKMQLHWQLITNQLKTEDPQDLIPLVNRICLHNGAPMDDSAWTSTGDLVFQNDQVEVDLKLWKITLKNAPTQFVKFPLSILQDPFIKTILPENELSTLNVLKEDLNGISVYSFKDKAGIPVQIEDNNGKYALYKEFDINGTKQWLQSFDLTPKTKDANYGNLSAASAYSLYKDTLAQMALSNSAISLFNNQLFVDPNNKKTGYVVDSTGKITFKVKLKQDSKNLLIDKVWDHRELPHTGPWEIHNASLLKSKSLDFLKGFENKNDIILWAKKGKLKNVELVRYGLKFDLVDGKLLCQSEPLKGYFLETTKNDFNLNHALVLEHPIKGKKLLLADVDALKSSSKTLQPKAKGFGRISLALHKMDVASNLIKGILPKAIQRDVSRFDPKKDKLLFTSFDLRAITGEICVTGNTSPKDLLQLIKHEINSGHPLAALTWIKDYPISNASSDTKLLGELIRFCKSDSSTGAEAAIKLKFALSLLKNLSDNRRLKDPVKESLEQSVVDNGKIVMRAGRRVPNDLQITDDQRLAMASYMKKTGDDFKDLHMEPYFVNVFIPDTMDPTIVDERIKAWESDQKPLLIEERITRLENTIKPSERLTDNQLSIKIEKLANPESILFTADKIQKHFTTDKVDLPKMDLDRTSNEKPYEKAALDDFQKSLDTFKADQSSLDRHILNRGSRRLQKLIDDKLLPKQIKFEEEMTKLQTEIEKSIREEKTTVNQLTLIAREKRVATFDELRDALIQGNLKDARISPDCDVTVLEDQLIQYFDALARRNATASAITLLEKMKVIGKQDTKNWNLMSKDLHRLLTLERKYDPKKHPELLVFESQLALNLKELDGGLNQLDLLEALLSDPSTLVQAPTGAGKTSVLSVLESLLKTNGENLVIQKVLPPLYNQTKDKVEDVIGDLFQTRVMPLRFNLKMRLTRNEIYKEKDENGNDVEKTKTASIFKGMYEELCEVILNKGCVLTDYTSFPMLEAKFLQIGQDLLECTLAGNEPTELQIEHHAYLRKILVLLRNKGLESMDEFDQPNRPIQKIQLDLQMGATDIPPFYIDTALEIYEILGNNAHLGLDKNIQADISQDIKNQALKDAAKEMAEKLAKETGKPELQKDLESYLLGENEDVLEQLDDVDTGLKDKISFSMKQFTIFLPLCLNAKEGSRYRRSDDGSKTLPCQNGQKHEAAKQGTLYEQLNYTIQDYRQKGIREYDLKTWNADFDPDQDQDDFNLLFPNYDVDQVRDMLKTEDGMNTLISEINQDKTKVLLLLRARIQLLKSSGNLISLDPTNVVDMSRAVSGISATSGANESFHKQFKQDEKAIGQIKASMAYRMRNRALEPDKVLTYDPEHPEKVLPTLTQPATTIIDGSGGFNDSTKNAADALLVSNPVLKQVGYHEDETITYNGQASGSLAETGFVFNEAHTRGTDILLAHDAHALLTANEKEGFRGFAQKEGRLRGEGQTYELAMPQGQEAKTLIEFQTKALCVDALQDAKDIYRHCTQEIRADLRNQMMTKLLAAEDHKEFVEIFGQKICNALFITEPEKSYSKPGSYFEDNRKIQRENIAPVDALKGLYAQNKKLASALGVELEERDYSALMDKMPTAVSSIASELECECEVEAELEIEAEIEVEVELEQNQELEMDQDQGKSSGVAYPTRAHYYHGYLPKAAVWDKINPNYDPRLFVTENFLPYERNLTKSKFKREAFERSMFNIGEVYISVNSQGIKNVVIEDPIYSSFLDDKSKGFIYDLRLGKVIKQSRYFKGKVQSAFTVDECVQSPAFHNLIAQIKFLDGRISGYSPEELAALKAWLISGPPEVIDKGPDLMGFLGEIKRDKAKSSINSGPEAMKKHFLNEVLLYRYKEKSRFEDSQLGQLFREII